MCVCVCVFLTHPHQYHHHHTIIRNTKIKTSKLQSIPHIIRNTNLKASKLNANHISPEIPKLKPSKPNTNPTNHQKQVAMTRARYPETVPFRLTRMLIHAMEGGGVEGA